MQYLLQYSGKSTMIKKVPEPNTELLSSEDIHEDVMTLTAALERQSTLNEVAGCLKYQGCTKTLDDMEAAIGEGIKEQWHDFSGS